MAIAIIGLRGPTTRVPEQHENNTKAYAYYTVAKELGRQDAATELQKLDDFLQPAIKTSAAELAKTISAGLKPVPRVIRLQTAETETAGPSPWPDPTPRPASP